MPTTVPRNLSAKWYHAQDVLDAEMRTVFRDSWLFCTNVLRLKKERCFVLDIAGNLVHLSYENDSSITASAGGQNVPAHVTKQGFIFVSLGDSPVPFSEFYSGLEADLGSADFNLEDWAFDSEHKAGGAFNWKGYVDNYAECYHCPTGHPVTFKDYDLKTYKVVNKCNYSQHLCARKNKAQDFGLGSAEGLWLWFYPNSAISIYSDAVSCMTIEPATPTTSRLRFQVFTRKGTPEAKKAAFYGSLLEVIREDSELTEGAQLNYERGIWYDCALNPTRENGVVFFQNKIREDVGRALIV